MKPADAQLDLLRNCVALRVQARSVRESVRVGLASIEQSLALHAGPLVRKSVAAKLLGVSVQAIDRHVAKGTIPTEPIAEGSTRSAIPIGPLLDIAYEQQIATEDSLAAAIDEARVRRLRTTEFITARNLTLFAHQIAHAARKRDAS
jgi:hypothetical protein